MALFDSFQALVGRAQGATRLFVRAGGFFNVGDVTGGADGTDITGTQLRYLLISPMTRASYTMASAIQTVSVIPNSCGLVDFFNPSAGGTSCTLPPANVGATLILHFPVVLCSTMSIKAGTSASLAIAYSDCSMIAASINGASGFWLQLQCVTANEWQVATTNGHGTAFVFQRSS